MKKLYKEQKHTLYEIQNAIGVSKITLYNYANKKRKVDNMPVSMILDIAYYEKIEPNKLLKEMRGKLKMDFSEIESKMNKTIEVLDEVKNQDYVKETFNDGTLFDDYYMTCIPWLSMEAMTHPLCDNNFESSSCPRICWDKYREENGKIVMLLNITVSHCFVDGYPLSCAFKNIQDNFNNIYNIAK